MQFGDPKKTVPLLIVAILAIGFCVKQVMGGSDEPKVLRQAATQDASAQPMPGGTLAMVQLDQLHTDPFSHPRLAPKGPADAGTPPQGSTPPVDDGKKGTPLPPPLGDGGSIDKRMDPTWPIFVHPDQKPDGDKGVQVVKVTQVTLKAIVKVNQRMAFLAVDGQEARGFKAGDVIKDDIVVAFVNDDSVIVRSGTKTVTLRVGQQGDL
ncbi:MAG TPA: hypothetical protein VHE55_02320 [Fimbriimonadaceae bacterium]|nr:hypothetical protein [Fimbriimonadaceae bacterium]